MNKVVLSLVVLTLLTGCGEAENIDKAGDELVGSSEEILVEKEEAFGLKSNIKEQQTNNKNSLIIYGLNLAGLSNKVDLIEDEEATGTVLNTLEKVAAESVVATTNLDESPSTKEAVDKKKQAEQLQELLNLQKEKLEILKSKIKSGDITKIEASLEFSELKKQYLVDKNKILGIVIIEESAIVE